MRYELNFYKSTGKWYTKETVDSSTPEIFENWPFYKDMDYTVHVVELDGFLQPFRMYKR